MPKAPPPPPAPPTPLAALAREGWHLTLPTEPSWAGPFDYTAYPISYTVRLAAQTQPGYHKAPARTDYTLTGPTERPRSLELWQMNLAQPRDEAVIAAALAAAGAPRPPRALTT